MWSVSSLSNPQNSGMNLFVGENMKLEHVEKSSQLS
jgi:hypothetical protein